jgi:glycosyltransferase involved in cell wall biosynthesis
MTTIHFFVESFDPRRGGMEESALRLIKLLGSDPKFRIVTYVLGGTPGPGHYPPEIARVVDISSEMLEFGGPIASQLARITAAQRARVQILLARNAAQDLCRSYEGNHVAFSFYLSTAGFIAQQIASDMQMPHIACSRGSDLGHNLFMPDRVNTIEFVVRRATRVVTTNSEHRQFIERILRRSDGVHTIYNALPENIHPVWVPHKGERVRLVTAGGYCVKKGTQILLQAVSQLLDEGSPVELSIVGPTRKGKWDDLRQVMSSRYGDRIAFGDMIEKEQVESFMLGGDVYCSASLSEGCPNAAMLALGIGMPIVCTATGALFDIAAGFSHVITSTPGNVREFTSALRRAVSAIQDENLKVDVSGVQHALNLLSLERERNEWKNLVYQVVEEDAELQKKSVPVNSGQMS